MFPFYLNNDNGHNLRPEALIIPIQYGYVSKA